MNYYNDEDMLMLSGIQHYMFCPRQWALIHIGQHWEENRLTAEGRLLHKNVDNPCYRQKNGDVVTLRSVPISSKSLGLYGYSDAIELILSEYNTDCIAHPKYPGYWRPYPVEYKRGHAKPDARDKVQLAAQVICLEEQYGIRIGEAFLFYAETNRRESVSIDFDLRNQTQQCADEMHKVFNSGVIPKAEKKHSCTNCSLFDVCIPEMESRPKVNYYLKKQLYEETA